MPNITLPNTQADGEVVDPEKFEENLCVPRTTSPASLEVINGLLDDANMESVSFVRDLIQRGEIFQGEQVGFSVPLDYFDDLFGGFVNGEEVSPTEEDNLEEFRPVPGLARTIYFRWNAPWVLVLFRVFCNHDGEEGNSAETPVFRLFMDGSFVSGQRRPVPPHVYNNIRYSAAMQREWSGHVIIQNVAIGWHDIYIAVASDAPHTRLLNGSIAVILPWGS
jgi:hypothetical protein